MSKKLILQFGKIALTLTPEEIELVITKLELKHGRKPTSDEFADAMMAHMTEHAKLARTVLHN